MRPDVRSRAEFVNHVLEEIYAPALVRQQDELADIINENTRILGSSSHSFNFLGETYRLFPNMKLPRRINRLHPGLHERMREWLSNRGETLAEKPYLAGFLRQVVLTGRNYSDYIALTPPVIHQIIHSIKANLPQGEVSLSADARAAFHVEHANAMFLIQQRMALNLILQ